MLHSKLWGIKPKMIKNTWSPANYQEATILYSEFKKNTFNRLLAKSAKD